MWMRKSKWREKRIFEIRESPFGRETRRNGAKPITTGRSGPMIAGVDGQQGPCVDRDCVGERDNHTHAFISPPLSFFTSLTTHGAYMDVLLHPAAPLTDPEAALIIRL